MQQLVVTALIGLLAAALLGYVLFGPDVRYVGSGLQRRRLTLAYARAALGHVLRTALARDNRWVKAHRLPVLGGGALVGLLLGVLAVGLTPSLLLGGGLGYLLPFVWYRLGAKKKALMQRALPTLVVNLASVLVESDNIYIALQLSVKDEPGPVFDHLRQALKEVGLNRSVFDMLTDLAREYRYDPFTTLVRVLHTAERNGTSQAEAVRQLEERLFIDLEAAARRRLATRSIIVLVVGVMGLLPAILCSTISVPLIEYLNSPQAELLKLF